MILAFAALALAFIAYLSFKNDNKEPDPEEFEETEPEPVKEKRTKKTVKDEPIPEETAAAGNEPIA